MGKGKEDKKASKMVLVLAELGIILTEPIQILSLIDSAWWALQIIRRLRKGI